MSNAAHPAYDRDSDAVDFGRLWQSVTVERVCVATGALSATVYVRRLPTGEYRVRKHNANGAYCWERDLSAAHAKAIAERCVDAFGSDVRLADRSDAWPSDRDGYGGGH